MKNLKKHFYYDWYDFCGTITEEWLKDYPGTHPENFIKQLITKLDLGQGKIIRLGCLDEVVPDNDPDFSFFEQEYGPEMYKFMRWLVLKGFSSNTALRYWW